MQVEIINQVGVLPTRGSINSAGYDLISPYDVIIAANNRQLIPLGIKIKLQTDTFGKIEMRSGLASKHGLIIMAGVVDSDYRGELKVAIYNSSNLDYYVKSGDRIAQLIIHKISTDDLILVDKLTDDNTPNTRGDNGFGSTGK